MAFKKKSTVIVGRGEWAVEVPRPPKHATHARMTASDPFSSDPTPKQVTLPIDDFGCFKGVSGNFYYLRMDNRRKITKEWKKDFWFWDGYKVVKIEKLRNQSV